MQNEQYVVLLLWSTYVVVFPQVVTAAFDIAFVVGV